jgi:hypothetical protein
MTAAATAPAAGADLKLEIRGGRVTLDARDVSLRQILAEWARVGQTRIVNLERLGSGPVTLQLAGVPERQALDIILRSASGYLAAPRAAGSTGSSTYDRILILASSNVSTAARSQTPARTPASAPARGGPPGAGFGPPELMLPDPGSQDDQTDEVDGPAARAPGPARGAARPGLPAPPAAAQPPGASGPLELPPADSQAPATPTTSWTIPAGTVTPGVIAPAAQSPGAPGTPPGTRPTQPDR